MLLQISDHTAKCLKVREPSSGQGFLSPQQLWQGDTKRRDLHAVTLPHHFQDNNETWMVLLRLSDLKIRFQELPVGEFIGAKLGRHFQADLFQVFRSERGNFCAEAN